MARKKSQPHNRRTARRPRGSLTRDVVLDAAEHVAGAGFEAVSMRTVAAQASAAPMALYNHFDSKDQLVDALLDRVLSRFEPDPATRDWRADLRRFARAHRRLLVSHRWAVGPLFTRPNPGLGAVRIGEHALAILARGGITGDRAVAAFSGVIALNYGWSSFTVNRDPTVGAKLAALPADVFPLTAGVADDMGAYGSDRHYERVLAALVGGLSGD